MMAVRAENIVKYLGKTLVLKGVSVDIKPGEFLFRVGTFWLRQDDFSAGFGWLPFP
jgi:ABC-type histidine transport system ATPase subunit